MDYRKHPSHIPHMNSTSPEYIQSEYDDMHLETEIKAHNYTLDRLKADLAL